MSTWRQESQGTGAQRRALGCTGFSNREEEELARSTEIRGKAVGVMSSENKGIER